MDVTTNFIDHSIRRVSALEVDELPLGRKVRLVVDLIEDGLGRAVRIPVVAVRGKRSGPVVGLTCALHGNELNGIPVVHRLIELLDPKTLRGTVVVCPVLNISGFNDHKRRYRDGKDLNHLMPGVEDGNESQIYAYRLFERIASRFDVLIDLHTASFGRINSLYVRADMENPVTARMAYLQRPRIILHNPPSDHTLRGAAAERGIPAITVEIGDPQVFQPRHIRPTLAGVRAVLSHLRMLPKRVTSDSATPIVCASSHWIYTAHGGLLDVLPGVAEQVESGATIARQIDIFGDLVCEYRAPADGVVIGKSVNPVCPTGARILHLGRIAGPEDGLLSATEAALGAERTLTHSGMSHSG